MILPQSIRRICWGAIAEKEFDPWKAGDGIAVNNGKEGIRQNLREVGDAGFEPATSAV